MGDGRKCTVALLDGRSLDFLVQPKLLAGDLLDIVASHFNLHEKEYFGLSHVDDTGNKKWLRLEKRVLDHSFSKNSCISLTFGIRFYVPKISQLKENSTVELFYLQAKSMISDGVLECDSSTIFHLAATVLQATCGDYVSETMARVDLKKLAVLPVKTLSEHPSLEFCEDQAIVQYRSLAGVQRGEAIVSYMNVVERLPMYGVHYYEAKDSKSVMPCYLGLSFRGVGQYDLADRQTPRKLFLWSQMENLYYRDKKFSIEVRDVSKSPSNHSVNRLASHRRNFAQNVNVITWLMSSASVCRDAWIMAVSQHQFHVDRRLDQRNTRQRSLREIAKELSRSDSSLALSFISDISETISETTSFSLDGADSGRASSAIGSERDTMLALKVKKERLEQLLQEKTDYLRHLCVEEAKITGKLPRDTPPSPSMIVEPYRRKIGTSFEFPDMVLTQLDNDEALSQDSSAQRDYEIQRQICKAAQRLAMDVSVSKRVRKERKIAYQKAVVKLKSMGDHAAMTSRRGSANYFQWSETGSINSSLSNDSLSRLTDDGLLGSPVPAARTNGHSWSPQHKNGITCRQRPSGAAISRLRRGMSATSEELLLEGRNQHHSSATQFVIGEFGNSGIYHNICGTSMSAARKSPSHGILSPPPASHRSLTLPVQKHDDFVSLPCKPSRLSAGSEGNLQWINGVAEETLV